MTRGFLRFLRGNMIALVALFLALGGTTYAASTALIGKNTVASPQVVNGSLQTKDLSKKARKALKGNRGLRGLRGPQGLPGAKGATGPQGPTGATGAAGSALAYAHVNANGTIDSAKNIAAGNVTKAGGGLYCFSGLGFTVHNITATPDFPAGRIAQARVDATGLGCGAGKSEVALYTADSPTLTDTAFYVVFN
jgi:hypothetical protein